MKKYLFWLLASTALLLSPVLHAQTQITCEDIAPAGVDPAYYIGLGDAYFGQRDYTNAIIAYTCALEADPEYTPAYVNRGFAYAAQGDETGALADYNRALELDEAATAAYANRGILYTTQGNFSLALLDFDLAIALNPDDAVSYNNRAVVHAAEGNYDLALADVQQAIALDRAYAAPHATLGAIYSAMAVSSYADYLNIAGENSRVPIGDPDTAINQIADSVQGGNFAVWLPLQTPAR